MEAHQHSPDSSSEECTVLEAPPGKNACPQHAGKVADLYCSACKCALCEDCLPNHAEHPKVALSQALEQHRNNLQERLGTVQDRLPQISDVLSFVKEIHQQLTNQRASIEEDIQSSFEDLHKQLDVRKSVLLMELEVTYGLKQKVLQAQIDSLLRGEGDITATCTQAEEALAGDPCVASLQLERELWERLGELAGLGLPCQPEENDQLDLVMETDGLRKSIHNLGTIVTTSAVASQSEAMGAGLEQCIVGHPASVTIVTRDKSGGACKSGNAILSAEVFTPDGSIVDGEIVDHKNGTYEFVYTVPKEGDFSLALRLYDQHIKGSPFKLTVTKTLEAELDVSPSTTTATNSAANATPSTGSSEGAKRRGKSPGQKKKGSKRASSALGTPRPSQVVLPKPKRLLILFPSNETCIQVSPSTTTATNSAANATPSTGSSEGAKRRGKSPGQKKKGSKRASSALGTPRRKTQNPIEDDLIFRIGTKGRNKGEFTNLQGVAASSNGRILIADSNNQCVQIFSNEGEFKSRFGVRGRSPGQLQRPTGPHFAAVNKNNEIIVTDFHNHSVKVFTLEGELVLKFGSNGEGNGQFNAPTGVAVDINGNIIVADWGNSRIQVFDGSGSFLSYINTSADPLYGPQGLALTSDGHVVVADSGNHCFKVYRYLQ
ncbi:tripartite motif-containing protein 2-like [Neolamprologus brichardi]|uniref:tripartite motif-containing protein 2-like n=1 Tax=Neolamprologus brichardi TaxID=32507 RepID=UPI0003EBC92B|nr:tripartite motif-containing protein 2-like [Neolamprologus brichardi]